MTSPPAKAKPMCVRHSHRVASAKIHGAYYCPECEQSEPSWMKRQYLSLLLAAAVGFCGCLKSPDVDPEPEPFGATVASFRDHRLIYTQACREIAAKAVSDEPFKSDREFTDFHNAKTEAARVGAFQKHFDRVQAELGDGKWSNEGVNRLFTQMADELEASQ